MSQTPTPEAAAQPAEQKPPRFGVQHLLSLLFAVVISVVIYLLRHQIEHLQALGYLGVFLFLALTNATLIMPAPTLVIVFVLGKSFNPLLLGLVAGAGSAVGEMTGYMAGYSGSGVVENVEAYRRVERYVKDYGMLPIVILAAIPNPLFDIAGFASGALGIPWWKFLLATFIGKSIKMVAVAFAGYFSLGWFQGFVRP